MEKEIVVLLVYISILVIELYSLQQTWLIMVARLYKLYFNTRNRALFFATIIGSSAIGSVISSYFNTRNRALFFAT